MRHRQAVVPLDRGSCAMLRSICSRRPSLLPLSECYSWQSLTFETPKVPFSLACKDALLQRKRAPFPVLLRLSPDMLPGPAIPGLPRHLPRPPAQHLPVTRPPPPPPPSLPRYLRRNLLLLSHRLRRPVQRVLSVLLWLRHQLLSPRLQQL
jgi:hypothetical protein